MRTMAAIRAHRRRVAPAMRRRRRRRVEHTGSGNANLGASMAKGPARYSQRRRPTTREEGTSARFGGRRANPKLTATITRDSMDEVAAVEAIAVGAEAAGAIVAEAEAAEAIAAEVVVLAGVAVEAAEAIAAEAEEETVGTDEREESARASEGQRRSEDVDDDIRLQASLPLFLSVKYGHKH